MTGTVDALARARTGSAAEGSLSAGLLEQKIAKDYAEVRRRLRIAPTEIKPCRPAPRPFDGDANRLIPPPPPSPPKVAFHIEPYFVRVVQRAVCQFYNISMDELVSDCRSRGIVVPRQVAMYLVRKYTSLSTLVIGARFGGRDHSTVMHSLKKVECNLLRDAAFAQEIEQLRSTIDGKPA